MTTPQQFWRIEPEPREPVPITTRVQWINPAYVVCIEDYPTWPTPTIQVTVATTITYGNWEIGGDNVLKFTGRAREQILRYMGETATG